MSRLSSSLPANKSNAGLLDEFSCPTDESARRERPRTGGNSQKKRDSAEVARKDGALSLPFPVEYVLAIIGSLTLLMLVVGGVSYYRALRM